MFILLRDISSIFSPYPSFSILHPLLDVTHHLLVGLEQYWYWVIGHWAIFADTGQYCYWGIFFCSDTQYDIEQTVVGTIHMITN